MYSTLEETRQKLSNCIVLYEEKPVYIIDTTAKKEVPYLCLTDLRTNTQSWVVITDKGFNFRNLGERLGYVNVDMKPYQEALYVTRGHIRKCQSTQGLSESNVFIPDFKGSDRIGTRRGECGWGSIYNKDFFLDTLEKKYPSVNDVVEKFKSNKTLTSLAFSKQFAVRAPKVGPFFLEYRGKDIGYTDDFETWKLSSYYKYLTESLEPFNLKMAA